MYRLLKERKYKDQESQKEEKGKVKYKNKKKTRQTKKKTNKPSNNKIKELEQDKQEWKMLIYMYILTRDFFFLVSLITLSDSILSCLTRKFTEKKKNLKKKRQGIS